MKHDWIKLKRHAFASCRRCHVVMPKHSESRDKCQGWDFPPVAVQIGTYRYIREDMVQEADDDK